MKAIKKEIKKGINLHIIETDKFKTNLIAVFLTTELNRENVTKNALISSVLRRGSKSMKTQEEISKQMEEMYGAIFDCGIDKMGDNQVLKFYIETINDNFLPRDSENILNQGIEKILEIVFNPYIENNAFDQKYIEQEKNNIRKRIEGKIDNKSRYALDRCIEEMYKNEPYGLYKFGYAEDLDKIDNENLYQYYKELICNCKVDIFVSGIVDHKTEDIVKNNENIKELNERKAKYNLINSKNREDSNNENIITESMNVTQGKLVLGLDVDADDDLRYDILMYNSILGGSANSKLFQNVREKANLAYIASSSYFRYKGNIFINCGIDIENYEKTLELIKKQIEDMKKGDFTEDEIENAKKGIIATIKTIEDEQDTQIMYNFSEELTGKEVSVENYIENIKKVEKNNIVDIANRIKINTIYFLKN